MEEGEQDILYCSEECAQAERTEEPKKTLCRVCGQPFVPSTPFARYCSEECELKALRDFRRRRAAERKEQEAAARKQKPLTINDVVRWTMQQYKQTGRMISYGNAVVILEAERN